MSLLPHDASLLPAREDHLSDGLDRWNGTRVLEIRMRFHDIGDDALMRPLAREALERFRNLPDNGADATFQFNVRGDVPCTLTYAAGYELSQPLAGAWSYSRSYSMLRDIESALAKIAAPMYLVLWVGMNTDGAVLVTLRDKHTLEDLSTQFGAAIVSKRSPVEIAERAVTLIDLGLAAERRWQPIETAPKDRSVLLYTPYGLTYCGRLRYGNLGEPSQGTWAWRCDSSGRFASPTHWMPLPAPPVGASPISPSQVAPVPPP